MNDNLKRILYSAKQAYEVASIQSVFDANLLYHCSWGMQMGYLISFNDLKELLDAIDPESKPLTLPDSKPDLPMVKEACYVWRSHWPGLYNSGATVPEQIQNMREYRALVMFATGDYDDNGKPYFGENPVGGKIFARTWDCWQRLEKGIPDYMNQTP